MMKRVKERKKGRVSERERKGETKKKKRKERGKKQNGLAVPRNNSNAPI